MVPLLKKTRIKSETDKLLLPVNIRKKVEILENQFLHRKDLEERGLQAMNRVLLVGAPGGGKTSLAKQISLDLDLNMDFHSIASIIDAALGGTGKQIHNIFKSVSSEMLFLDEFDAIGASRDQGNDLGEMRRVVNVLLQEMDNLSSDSLLVAATNFPEKLDSAVLRRFSTVIELPKPDIRQRVRYMQEFSLEHKISIEKKEVIRTAKITDGLSYADLRSFMMNFAIAEVSGYEKELRLSKYYIEELSMRQTINDQALAKWVNDKSISITDLSEALDVPRTTLSDRLKRVGGNDEKE
ncbi:AAA family ATPase [Lacticaseibacillus pantheris]|uniref:AAA family ATPase n=1 Tax=Lacticaseibacillus pantheris TaxID=171523 RepID=UPI0006D0B92C|nr:ATP-binding protein [Lacticaseibacillus pantheris]